MAFANTAGARKDNRQLGVASYAELVTWGQQAGVLSTFEAKRLRRLAAERPKDAEAAYATAVRLRHLLLRLFSAAAAGGDLPQREFDELNTELGRVLKARRLVLAESGPAWGWAGDDDALDRMLWPVVYSAADTLVELTGRPQMRQCARKGCHLYFLDRAPGRQRRWCDTKTCGSRASSLKFYYRRARAERDKSMHGTGLWRVRRPRKRTRS